MDKENALKIAELRDEFFKKLQNEGPPNSKEFHPADIDRIKSGDTWLRRFLEHNEYNIQNALKMLWESCEWRRNFDANNITEDNVRNDYLKDGFCNAFGKDKDGKRLFVIRSKLYIKGSKDFVELQRCMIYWLERLERECNGDQISLFFDMVDAGYTNFDLDLVKYVINLFKYYYPNFLNLIIILEMPRVLNIAFKLIKSLLPEKAKPKIKLVNKATLFEFVDPDEALTSWGGNNDSSFEFISESDFGSQVESDANKIVNENLDQRKVRFLHNELSNLKTKLIVEPETLIFSKFGNEVSSTILLQNTLMDQNLAYKIKTSSPKKFKVRPNTGILLSSQKITITVLLQSEQCISSSDKFQVLCLPVTETELSIQELTTLFKTNETGTEQHRLVCQDLNEKISNQVDLVSNKIPHSEKQYQKLQKDIICIKSLMYIMICALIVSVCIFYHLLNNFQNNMQQRILNCDANVKKLELVDTLVHKQKFGDV